MRPHCHCRYCYCYCCNHCLPLSLLVLLPLTKSCHCYLLQQLLLLLLLLLRPVLLRLIEVHSWYYLVNYCYCSYCAFKKWIRENAVPLLLPLAIDCWPLATTSCWPLTQLLFLTQLPIVLKTVDKYWIKALPVVNKRAKASLSGLYPLLNFIVRSNTCPLLSISCSISYSSVLWVFLFSCMWKLISVASNSASGKK